MHGKTAVLAREYRARLFQATYVRAFYRMIPDLGRNTYSMKRKRINLRASHGDKIYFEREYKYKIKFKKTLKCFLKL